MTAAAKTPAQRGQAARRKGAVFERAIVTALRPWFPDIRRSRDNGSATTSDTGDLIDAGPFWWSLKDDKSGDLSTPSVIDGWWRDAETKAGDLTPLLVQKRRGHTDPLHSWVWLRACDFAHFATGADCDLGPGLTRLELGFFLAVLVRANYALDPRRRFLDEE